MAKPGELTVLKWVKFYVEIGLEFCLYQQKATVLMLRLSYPAETVLSNKNTRNRIVLSIKDSPENHEDGDLEGLTRHSFTLRLR